MSKRTLEQTEAVNSREALAAYVRDLRRELLDDPASWENNDLSSFLDGLAGWTEDMDGFYQNMGMPVPQNPSWKTFAQMLAAAACYE